MISETIDIPPVGGGRSHFAYTGIAIEKTAGPREREAWTWLLDAVAAWHQSGAQR
jgi:hypothetical protein